MATTTTPPSLSASTSTSLSNGAAKASPRPLQSAGVATLPALPPPSLHRARKLINGYRQKMARDVAPMATGDASAEVGAPDVSELLKPVQEAWDKVEDKYAVSSLVVAAGVALWGSTGMISAIDKLPLIPGVLELVGIGYTGWFAYKNLIFKPEREALIDKIKCAYKDIIGSS